MSRELAGDAQSHQATLSFIVIVNYRDTKEYFHPVLTTLLGIKQHVNEKKIWLVDE